jgi:hypothetical protein
MARGSDRQTSRAGLDERLTTAGVAIDGSEFKGESRSPDRDVRCCVAATSTARRSLRANKAAITVTVPKPLRSRAKSDGRSGKQDFAYLPVEDAYRCPTGERREEAVAC